MECDFLQSYRKSSYNFTKNVPGPICDILLSSFIFLFFDDFNSFLIAVANSYNKRIRSYNCRDSYNARIDSYNCRRQL